MHSYLEAWIIHAMNLILYKPVIFCLLLSSVNILSCTTQSVTCLTADPGVASFIQAQSNTFMEIDHEIISTAILLPLIQEGLLLVTSKSICTKYWLVA